MRILLIGEYSNVHWTLAEGLRALGHEVCVVSNGDFWKNYRRNISLVRNETSRFAGVKYLLQAYALLPRLRNYDVVQLINPMFLELKAERIAPFYNRLKKQNKKIFLCAYGIDAYWVDYCTRTPYPFRYSDFNIGDRPIDNDYVRSQRLDWQNTPKQRLNHIIANECNGIIAGMYEYHTAYSAAHSNKLCYIPFPITANETATPNYRQGEKVRFFIGIQKSRNIYKGTDIMLRALEQIAAAYPERCEVLKAENVPFDEYTKLIENCHVLLDQLYGYSPGMNALLALSKGKIVVGGAEEECYRILGEESLRPMVNVVPDEKDVYRKLEYLVLHSEDIARLQAESIEFVRRHHDAVKVAQQYLDFWESK